MRKDNRQLPYGYRYGDWPAARKRLLAFPVEQERLSFMVQMRDKGASFHSIAKKLERVRIRKRNQKPFTHNAVADIIYKHRRSRRGIIPLNIDSWYSEMERKHSERERKKTEQKDVTERSEIEKTVESIKRLVDQRLPIE
tara:strand:+ start:162 stop:581 length:420 start_codon:yes stop_codon:yes gene_type:complete